MIKPPPKKLIHNPLQIVLEKHQDQLEQYIALFSPTDHQGRYLHFDQLRFRLPKGIEPELAWSIVKAARHRQQQPVISLNENSECCFCLTPTIQKAISETDRNTTSATLEWMCSKIGEEKHIEYLLNDLLEDEAISSSQLEGAATTTKVAKDLLKRSRKPSNPNEKMIIGNFKMMRFAWENRHQNLSLDLISDLHRIGVENINDAQYTPGIFRTSDDVAVVDVAGNTVHTPPPASGLTSRLKNLCDWVNRSHHDADRQDYLHPIIKAITIHFVIGFEHPFRDGNGRVARALFYWYLFKNDFAAFRYITISLLLKNAPIQYGKSYLYTETDGMDLTYFIEYQCSIIIRAIKKFKEAFQKTLKETELFNQWLWQSGLYKQLSDKQQAVFHVAKSGVAHSFTVANVQENLGCSYSTAVKVLNGLVALNLFTKQKEGREWVYRMLSQQQILEKWHVHQ